jgi:hypothetical protein
MLEEDSGRMVWVPAISTGYIFTLSGFIPDFIVAVMSIVGARLFLVSKESGLFRHSDEGIGFANSAYGRVQHHFPLWRSLSIGVVALLYLVAWLYVPFRLAEYFEYRDPVLVAISGFYVWLVLEIVLRIDDIKMV